MSRNALMDSSRLLLAAVALAWALSGCNAMQLKATPQPAFYTLDNPTTTTPAQPPGVAAATLIVNPPHAASGFDSQRIIYVRATHQLEYFAHSEWVDTPARMLAPLIVTALQNRGAFRAVVLMPSAASGDLRLDTEILRLQQDFAGSPSRGRFTLRAYLEDSATRRILATREFDASVAAGSDDPQGGVVAANQAVWEVLQQLADFCVETAPGRKPRTQ